MNMGALTEIKLVTSFAIITECECGHASETDPGRPQTKARTLKQSEITHASRNGGEFKNWVSPS